MLGQDRRENTSALHVVAGKTALLPVHPSIKRGNWFYWADRAETAERTESKEYPEFMRILSYVP
jgi:hypothetical protein